jgi:hypothetical protein
MRPLLQSALVAILLLSTGAYAQSREVRQDRAELSQTKRESRDDQRDRAQAATLLRRYDSALAHRDLRTLTALDREALHLMDRELAEGRREVRSDRLEVVRSSYEASDSRRDRATASRPPAVAEARRDVRDDQRDLRDDKRDLRVESKDLQHVRAIRADFAQLSGRTSRGSVQKKRALLADFLARSHHELGQNGAEYREDRRERREDSRDGHR